MFILIDIVITFISSFIIPEVKGDSAILTNIIFLMQTPVAIVKKCWLRLFYYLLDQKKFNLIEVLSYYVVFIVNLISNVNIPMSPLALLGFGNSFNSSWGWGSILFKLNGLKAKPNIGYTFNNSPLYLRGDSRLRLLGERVTYLYPSLGLRLGMNH